MADVRVGLECHVGNGKRAQTDQPEAQSAIGRERALASLEHERGYGTPCAQRGPTSGTLHLCDLGPLRLDGGGRDLARVGEWLVAVGAVAVLFGTTVVAAGLLPGLLAVGAGLACCLIGGLALAWVAHHQG